MSLKTKKKSLRLSYLNVMLVRLKIGLKEMGKNVENKKTDSIFQTYARNRTEQARLLCKCEKFPFQHSEYKSSKYTNSPGKRL